MGKDDRDVLVVPYRTRSYCSLGNLLVVLHLPHSIASLTLSRMEIHGFEDEGRLN